MEPFPLSVRYALECKFMVLGTKKQPVEVECRVVFFGCRKGGIQYPMIPAIQGVAKNFRGGGMIVLYFLFLLFGR